MRITVNRKDAIWSYLGVIIAMSANFIILPFILRFLSDEAIAVYYVFTSLSGIAALFDFGFSPSIARSMAYAWSGVRVLKKNGSDDTNGTEPNYLLINRIIKSCRLLYLFIGVIVFLLLITVGTSYIKLITQETSSSEYITAWFLYSIAIFLNVLYGYYTVFLRGVGAVFHVNLSTIISKIIQIVLCIVLVIQGMGLLGVSIAYLFYGLIFRLLASHYFYTYHGLKHNLKQVTEKTAIADCYDIIRIMWPNTWKDGVVTVANYGVNQALTIISSLFLSLKTTGVFSLCNQLTTAIATVSLTLFTAYQPALQSASANNEEKQQREYLSVSVIAFLSLYTCGMVFLLTIGIPLIEWLKPSYTITPSILFLSGIFQFLLYLRNCYCSYISTTNRLIYWKSFCFSSVLCLILSCFFILLLKMDVYGILFAQIISQIVFNAWYWPILVHKELHLSIKDMFEIGFGKIKQLIRK